MLTILAIISLVLNFTILAFLILRKSSDNSTLIKESNERIGRALREEMSANRTEMSVATKETREEIGKSIKNFGDSVDRRIFSLTEVQNKNFSAFSDKLGEVIEKNDKRMDYVRETIEKRLENIQKDNSEKLEKMRETVDEKLHATLEKRLGESFKLVSERLELVHKGLGEMQTLASGVGDLKKVLQNVKTELLGVWILSALD